ncbi:MAG: EAL domain-containing protein [Gammaproteobacteria bacterium]|nr:EAL domain-containing protein [Gammaproteobacteria bacterium]
MSDAFETEDLSVALAALVGEHLSSVTYTAGSVIFREGEAGDHAYLIESGLVEISCTVNGGKVNLGMLGPGELVGEMASLDNQQRSATATVICDTEVMPISAEHLQKLVNQTHPLVNLLLRLLLNRFRFTQHQALFGANENGAGDSTSALKPDEVLEAARTRAVERIKFEQALQEAIRRREFELYYQPVVNLRDRSIAGFEALIRWCSPERGMVLPKEFIGVAEETGLIVPIGLWVIEHAFRHLARFQVRFQRLFPNRPPLFMSANVSGRQLESPSDVETIAAVIRNVGVDPKSVKLEITEAVLMSNPDVVRAGLTKLKNLGLTLAIDDFGTGYSSLSYLHSFQIDTLKIDRSFVNTMLTDKESNKIVKSIVGLARSLKMDIIAEGVERPEEVAELEELGCSLAQGYLFARPAPAEQVMEMLEIPLELGSKKAS